MSRPSASWVAGPLRCIAVCCICLVIGAIAGSTGEASDWPQFLGPLRNGISSEMGLIAVWPADGPKEVWRTAGGVGMSGLAISRGRLITLVQHDGQQWLACHDSL